MGTKNQVTGNQFHADKRKGLLINQGAEWRPIAPYLEVRGRAREEGGRHYLVVVKFEVNGRIAQHLSPREDILTPSAILKALAGEGYDPPSVAGDRKLVLEYLAKANPDREFLVVRRTGWCQGNYIYANGKQLKARKDSRIILDPCDRRSDVAPPSGGTLKDWQREVAVPATHSSRMMFAIATSFGSLLLERTSIESGVFHLFGRSSSGKSLIQAAALSVHQRASRLKLSHWDVTPAGLEELAAKNCDRLLVLDDTGHLSTDPHKAAQMARTTAFKLTAGSARIRSSFFSKEINDSQWRLLGLSSGEQPISAYASRTGRDRLKGEEVRLIDVPAVVSDRYGIFETVPPGFTSHQLAKQIEAGCESNFGHPARKFIRGLLKDQSGGTTITKRIAKEMAFFLANVSEDGWERRFAARFALAYAASELAREFGILPWKKEETLAAIQDTYNAARESIPNSEAMLDTATDKVRRHLLSGKRVIDLRSASGMKIKQSTVKARAFIKDDERNGIFFAVKPKAIKRWIGPQAPIELLGTHWRNLKFLLSTGRNLPTKQVQIPGVKGRRTYYCFKEAFVYPGQKTDETMQKPQAV